MPKCQGCGFNPWPQNTSWTHWSWVIVSIRECSFQHTQGCVQAQLWCWAPPASKMHCLQQRHWCVPKHARSVFLGGEQQNAHLWWQHHWAWFSSEVAGRTGSAQGVVAECHVDWWHMSPSSVGRELLWLKPLCPLPLRDSVTPKGWCGIL